MNNVMKKTVITKCTYHTYIILWILCFLQEQKKLTYQSSWVTVEVAPMSMRFPVWSPLPKRIQVEWIKWGNPLEMLLTESQIKNILTKTRWKRKIKPTTTGSVFQFNASISSIIQNLVCLFTHSLNIWTSSTPKGRLRFCYEIDLGCELADFNHPCKLNAFLLYSLLQRSASHIFITSKLDLSTQKNENSWDIVLAKDIYISPLHCHFVDGIQQNSQNIRLSIFVNFCYLLVDFKAIRRW